MIDLKTYREDFEKPIAHLHEELRGIRTGRAQSSMVENILVDSYGVPTPLKGLASLSIPDARTIFITPWDPSIVKEIEKALAQSSLGAQPINEGASIRMILPQLTEENRRAFAKAASQKCEQAKISIRLLRDKIREEIVKQEKSKELTEDDRFDFQKKLDETVKEYTMRVDMIGEEKEIEITTI